MRLGRAETETSIGAAEWLSLAPSDERYSARTRRTGNPADEVRDLDLRHVGIGLLKARDGRVSRRRRAYSTRLRCMKAANFCIVSYLGAGL
jgi:hypothetical protein